MKKSNKEERKTFPINCYKRKIKNSQVSVYYWIWIDVQNTIRVVNFNLSRALSFHVTTYFIWNEDIKVYGEQNFILEKEKKKEIKIA